MSINGFRKLLPVLLALLVLSGCDAWLDNDSEDDDGGSGGGQVGACQWDNSEWDDCEWGS